MKAFVSYATEEKVWASHTRRALEALGLAPFLAHDDIEVSAEWQKRITEELAEASVFVAILSRAFKASNGCSQEIGWISSRQGVVVIPLSIDSTTSYGFISHIQSRRMTTSEQDLDTALTYVLLGKFPRLVIPQVINRVRGARSFRSAEFYMRPLVPHFAFLDQPEATSLAQPAIENGQVWDAGLCRTEYLPQFLRLNRTQISPDQFTALASKIGYNDQGA